MCLLKWFLNGNGNYRPNTELYRIKTTTGTHTHTHGFETNVITYRMNEKKTQKQDIIK